MTQGFGRARIPAFRERISAMNEKINIRGVSIDNVTMDEAAEAVQSFLKEDGPHAVYTPNAEIIQACIEQPELSEVINGAELIIPDGAGVVLASRILGTPLKGKTPGIELGERLIALSAETGCRIFFLGGRPQVAELAKEKLLQKYPGAQIVGTHDGYFQKEGAENDEVIRLVNAAAPDILFVCFGVPAQEKWIAANRERMPSVRVFAGLGGSLDGYAGVVKRAPQFFIRCNLEWFYRLIKEPRRIGRMMKLPKFIGGTVVYRLTGRGRRDV